MVQTPRHIAIIAGEQSGDRLGAPLMEALRELWPSVRFTGIGGAMMQNAGLQSLADINRLSVMGLVEVLKHLPDLLRLKSDLLEYWHDDPPDLFIGVDAPDFNLRIAQHMRGRGVTTVHYVSPSLWAWKEKRIEKIKVAVDLVLCLFPFETAVYQRNHVRAVCVGHTLRDRIAPMEKAVAEGQLGLPATLRLGIFPGSRSGEINRLLPVYLCAFAELRQQLPELHGVVSCVLPEFLPTITEQCAGYEGISISDAPSNLLMSACDALLLTSGTITLEAALLERPMVVAYRVQWLTAQIAKRMLKIDRFSLPNLLAGRDVVRECIQDECNSQELASALLPLLADPVSHAAQRTELAAVAAQLPDNVSARAAAAIAALCGGAL
ncbi:lipid-A-disaccharide synthase [Cardiobacteriaceae bacterium TAE3-ERU3]|nr:lipid-A-disaccharide synthase [Cardiobacteriaceae bacterium TAE3-ERU3]